MERKQREIVENRNRTNPSTKEKNKANESHLAASLNKQSQGMCHDVPQNKLLALALAFFAGRRGGSAPAALAPTFGFALGQKQTGCMMVR